ncbi:5-bromo-4-chloroindolyl phosphate hydrolysis family protein [Cetobacterium sp.]|uniref:5-bromo-4-chloroindolyl phosphate hydrolysis family protein n=1 Tax=Cetobacterium sp. TaxID=2071632 RepID=UPI003F3BBB20
MDKKDFSNLEDQIMSTVNNAIKAIDFANLKKDINYKTEDTLNQLKIKIGEYSGKCIDLLNKKSKNDISKYISKKPAGTVSGTLCIVFGSIGSVVLGFSTATFLLVNSLFTGGIIGSNVVIGVLLIFSGASLGLLLNGINLKKRIKRFKLYVRFIENNRYFLIEDLARFAKQKEGFILKDLRKMIDLGMFLEGHIDEEKTYFMISDEVYNDYLNLKKEQIVQENNKKLSNENYSSKNEEIEATIKIGRNYIQQIKSIRSDLYKEKIAKKLEKLEKTSVQILNQIEKNPEKIGEVNKFINHYLPITIKLISSYKDMNSQSVQSENIKNAKGEIEKSIDVINLAFENLLNDLFEDVVLDVSTDISVLKTLFKQDGLAEEDFKK